MDHIAEAKQAAADMETARLARADAAARRRAAVQRARETMSAQEVAEHLGISRARVYAIAAGRE